MEGEICQAGQVGNIWVTWLSHHQNQFIAVKEKGTVPLQVSGEISVIVRIATDMWRKLPPLCPPENNADETPMASDSSTKYFFVFRK